ncbi:MAG: hypothetical protein P8Y54_14240 [Xanthomonadales bacterium]
MIETHSRTAAARCDDPDAMRAQALSEEIDFWAGMLNASQATAPAESIERMKFALALAEFRLRELRQQRSN